MQLFRLAFESLTLYIMQKYIFTLIEFYYRPDTWVTYTHQQFIVPPPHHGGPPKIKNKITKNAWH